MEDETVTTGRRDIALLLGDERGCSYLPAERASTLVVAPDAPIDDDTYARLLQAGFRRSGEMLYRPYCRNCAACVPVRVEVAGFRPDRAQRRCLRLNADLEVTLLPAGWREDHFALYRDYLAARHGGGGMDNPDAASFLGFLTSHWARTAFHEFRRDRRLVAVAVTDHLPEAASAVYTFFDPELERRGPGTHAVLHQIDHARRHGQRYLYLGYSIAECRNMRYKERFRPQRLGPRGWA